MVLVDTSVWINHFIHTDTILEGLLNDDQVVMHPCVAGELACGNFKNRKEIFRLLNDLPLLQTISDEEYHFFVERHKLFGTGIGFVDIHLLASAFLAHCTIYSRDKHLIAAARSLKIALIP